MIINIALCFDKNYQKPIETLFFSILKNSNKLDFYYFFLISFEEIKLDQKIFNKLKSMFSNFEINFTLASTVVEQIKVFQKNLNLPSYISKDAFLKLFLRNLLPKNIEKILYLDSDVLVNCDLANLFKVDLQTNVVGATIDLWAPSLRKMKKYIGHKYFNVGVLLIDLNQFTIDGNSLRKFNELFKKVTYGEQDLFNFFFKNKILEIPLSFNLQRAYWELGFLKIIKKITCFWIFNNLSFEKKSNELNIIHYNGKIKPWNKKYFFMKKKYRNLYFKYVNDLNDLVSN